MSATKSTLAKNHDNEDVTIYSFLNNLTNITDNSCVKVRITRLWDTMTIGRKREFISTDMVLIDEKSNYIHGTIPKSLAHEFKKKLQEGKIYVITNFEVSKAKKNYAVVEKNPDVLQFHANTKVIEEDCDDGTIPLHIFEFVKFESLEDRFGKQVYADVIGVVTDVNPIEERMTVHGKTNILTFDLKDIRGNTVNVTLWGEYASKFEETFKENMFDAPNPNVAVITSTMVKKFQGDICLSSTSSTNIYVNIDVPEATELIQSFKTTNDLEGSAKNGISHVNVHSSIDKTRTISELLSLAMSGSNMNSVYYCAATISEILDKNKWYYVSCPFCKKGASATQKNFNCENCKKTVDYPVTRFRLELNVKDSTDSTIFVLFDTLVEQVAHVKLNDLSSSLENETGGIPPIPQQLQKIIGSTHIFQIKMKSYFESRGRQSFTVSKILNPKVKVEKDDKADTTNASSSSSPKIHTPQLPLKRRRLRLQSDDDDASNMNQKVIFEDLQD